MLARQAYSYRADTAVPPFPDDRPLIVFDGVCALCSSSVRFVLRRDSQGQFRFASAQSALGKSFYNHYGLDAQKLESALLIADGKLYLRSDAALEIIGRFGGAWQLLRALRLIPRTWRDWLYNLTARHRYRWFGQHEYCGIPDPALADRFLAP